jgi:hypothetical protein
MVMVSPLRNRWSAVVQRCASCAALRVRWNVCVVAPVLVFVRASRVFAWILSVFAARLPRGRDAALLVRIGRYVVGFDLSRRPGGPRPIIALSIGLAGFVAGGGHGAVLLVAGGAMCGGV